MSVISALVYTVTDTTIVATWTTDVSSDSNLSAGGKAAIDNGVAASSTSHQCIVTGLSPSTLYSCFVTSGGTSSTPQNVTTNAAQTRTPITNVGVPQDTVMSAFHGDSVTDFISNDGVSYNIENDGYGWAPGDAGANMQVGSLSDERNLLGTNINLLTGFGSYGQATAGPGGSSLVNKVFGILSMAGNLFITAARQTAGSPFTDSYGNVMKSPDHGATWSNWQNPTSYSSAGVIPSNVSTFFSDITIGAMMPVRYAADDGTLGYLTSGNQIDGANGFIYFTYISGLIINTNNLYLMRVPRIQLNALNNTAFQFWVGPASPTLADFVNDSNWSSSSASATAIYTKTGKVSWSHISFVPAFNQYVMVNWYYTTPSSASVWEVLQASTPAGPWTSLSVVSQIPQGWFSPSIMHRTSETNQSLSNVYLKMVYSGDYGGAEPYYYPTTSSLILNPPAVVNPMSVVNFATGGGVGSSLTATTSTFSSTTHNLLVVGVRGGSGSLPLITSVKNAAGVSFVLIPGSEAYADSTQATQLYYLKNITGNAFDSVTVTFSAKEVASGVCVWEIQGADLINPLDTSAVGIHSGVTTTMISAPFSTIERDEIACVIGGVAEANQTYSFSGYSLDSAGFPAGAGNLFVGAAHKLFTNFQGNATATVAVTPGFGSASISVATFCAAAPWLIVGNAGIAGATISYTGASSGSATADGSGNYTIGLLANGSYTITPSKTGYTFSPTSASETVSGADITGVNFTASAAKPVILFIH